MPTLKVPKKAAEETRKDLLAKDRFDTDRVTEEDQNHVYFPIKKEFSTKFEILDKELPKRETNQSYEDALQEKLTPEEMAQVKTAQDLIGDIAIIEVSEALEDKQKLLGETLLEAKPYLNTVLKKGKHEGKYRIQELEWLAGEKKKETIHTENNCRFKLNVEDVYFSPRLSTERERIAGMVKPDERVLVMFSGCAPYPCVIAKNTEAKEVIGVEINPVGHKYGLENVELNKLDNVQLYQGDVASVVPELEGRFDRIVMPAPDNASEYLETALKKIKPGGTIHYYDFIDEENIPEEPKANIEEAAEKTGKEYEILHVEKCGSVSPGRYRTCVDFKVK